MLPSSASVVLSWTSTNEHLSIRMGNAKFARHILSSSTFEDKALKPVNRQHSIKTDNER
jgi:hypothetical protein